MILDRQPLNLNELQDILKNIDDNEKKIEIEAKENARKAEEHSLYCKDLPSTISAAYLGRCGGSPYDEARALRERDFKDMIKDCDRDNIKIDIS